MKNASKCLEYYLDSKVYNYEDVEKNIEETKKDFPKKKFTVNVTINSFGMYVITFIFENKETWFSKIILYFKRKKVLLLQEENANNKNNNFEKEENKRLEKAYRNQYGKYKSTGIYKPY